MNTSVAVPTTIHKVRPCNRGRTPTFLSVSLFSPVPIKNSVAVRPILPRWLRAEKVGFRTGSSVLRSAARQKKTMNQGQRMRALLLSRTVVATDRGTIQERASQFHRSADGQRGGSILRSRSHDGTGVMNGKRCPKPELRLGHVKGEANHRKKEQRNRIKNKHGPERDRHFLFAGICNRADSGDGAASAYCRPHAD